VTINLRYRLPGTSSSQPEGLGRAPLAPSYLALLRAGFGRPPIHIGAGGLLPHHFTLTPIDRGGMFLCHFPSGRPAWALPSALPVRSSDLPPRRVGAVTRPAENLLNYTSLGVSSGPRASSSSRSSARFASASARLFSVRGTCLRETFENCLRSSMIRLKYGRSRSLRTL
jgi:hypothetical protein